MRVVGAAILRDGRCLAAQRSAAMSEPLKWEFPGGKVRPGEELRDALGREIREELDLRIEVGDWLGRGGSLVADRRIELDVFTATVVSGELRLAEHRRCDWFHADEIDRLDWAAADRPVLAPLKRLLRSHGPTI
ncbi:MAG: (deoxy)nucleoside triphosphate pyrophosphohydrolase [bacterium]|nr:(deoxy)nucleoside triphosphate pyrophosphohydrolase [bacterium]